MGGTPILPAPGQPAPLAPGEFTGASKPQEATFERTNLSPPSMLYIQRDDLLVVESQNAVGNPTITFRGRLLRLDGVIQPIERTITTAPQNVTNQITIQLVEGFLLSFVCVSTGSINQGDTFVRAFINRGPTLITNPNAAQILFADYVTDTAPVGWPGGRVVRSTEGPGSIRSVAGTTPAAGADFTYTVTAGTRQKIRALRAQLATSGVAGNRTPKFRIIDNAGGVLVVTGSNNTQIAGQTIGYTLAAGITQVTVSTVDLIAPLPTDLILAGSWQIVSVTAGLLVGDQWSAIQVLVEQWLAFESQ